MTINFAYDDELFQSNVYVVQNIKDTIHVIYSDRNTKYLTFPLKNKNEFHIVIYNKNGKNYASSISQYLSRLNDNDSFASEYISYIAYGKNKKMLNAGGYFIQEKGNKLVVQFQDRDNNLFKVKCRHIFYYKICNSIIVVLSRYA